MTKWVKILGLSSALVVTVVGSTSATAKTTTRAVPAVQGAGKQIPSTRPPSPNAVPGGYLVIDSGLQTACANCLEYADALCPTTSSGVQLWPQGGGVFITSTSLFANVTWSVPLGTTFNPPSPPGWEGLVENQSGAATTFDVWAVCAKPHTAYTLAESADITVFAHSQSGFTEYCPTGTKILGGGGWVPNYDFGDAMNSSYPVSGGQGWHVDMNNGSSSDTTFRVDAVCSKYSIRRSGYGVHVGNGVDNPPGSQTVALVACPSGQVPLGGGVYSSGNNTSVNINSTFPISGGWEVYENNASSSDFFITPFVICAA